MIKDLKAKEGIRLLNDNCIGRLAYISKGSPFIVPVTYYFDETDNCIISYSGEGHKISAMRENPSVSLEVDEIASISNWKSVLVLGIFEELSGSDAKMRLHQFTQGVKSVIQNKEHRDLHFIGEFSSKMNSEEIPLVYRIKIIEIFGKETAAQN